REHWLLALGIFFPYLFVLGFFLLFKSLCSFGFFRFVFYFFIGVFFFIFFAIPLLLEISFILRKNLINTIFFKISLFLVVFFFCIFFPYLFVFSFSLLCKSLCSFRFFRYGF